MLLSGLSCLLCNGSLYCPSVSEGAGLESLCISRKILDGGIGDVVCKFLELGIFGNEVGLASEAPSYRLRSFDALSLRQLL